MELFIGKVVMIKVSSLKCKISKGGYAKLSHKLIFRE